MERLEGVELEGKIGEVGSYELDVDAKGSVKFSAKIEKDFGYAKASTTASVEASIFSIAEKIAANTKTTWDDSAIAALKKLLGIVD